MKAESPWITCSAMTDDELQEFCGRNVELKSGNLVFVGKLICGEEARRLVNAPYAIASKAPNATLGTIDTIPTPVAGAEAVEWVHVLNESLSDERLED
jgi:hypothetical protein